MKLTAEKKRLNGIATQAYMQPLECRQMLSASPFNDFDGQYFTPGGDPMAQLSQPMEIAAPGQFLQGLFVLQVGNDVYPLHSPYPSEFRDAVTEQTANLPDTGLTPANTIVEPPVASVPGIAVSTASVQVSSSAAVLDRDGLSATVNDGNAPSSATTSGVADMPSSHQLIDGQSAAGYETFVVATNANPVADVQLTAAPTESATSFIAGLAIKPTLSTMPSVAADNTIAPAMMRAVESEIVTWGQVSQELASSIAVGFSEGLQHLNIAATASSLVSAFSPGSNVVQPSAVIAGAAIALGAFLQSESKPKTVTSIWPFSQELIDIVPSARMR